MQFSEAERKGEKGRERERKGRLESFIMPDTTDTHLNLSTKPVDMSSQ